MSVSEFEANGGFTLRVASASGRRLSSYRRPLFPSMRVPGEPSPEGCAVPLMASRRRQRRAAAASFLAYPTKRRHHGLARSFASVARPPISMMADAAVPPDGGRWARPASFAPRLLGAFPKARSCSCAQNCC